VYTKSIPTVVVWDSSWHEEGRSAVTEDDDGGGDQVWEGMENAEDDKEDESSPNSSHKKSRTR